MNKLKKIFVTASLIRIHQQKWRKIRKVLYFFQVHSEKKKRKRNF